MDINLQRELSRLDSEAERLMNQEEYALLEEVLKEKYRIIRESYGDKNIAAINAMDLIAMNYYHMEQYDKALTILKKVLELRTVVQGRFHEDRFTTLKNISLVLKEEFGWAGMPELLKTVKELYLATEKMLGADADETIDAHHEYAVQLYRYDKYEEAFAHAKDIFDICYKKYGFHRERTQAAIRNLRSILDHLRLTDETVGYYEMIYEVYRTFYGNGNEKILSPMMDLCRARVDNKLCLQDEDYKEETIAMAKCCEKLARRNYFDASELDIFVYKEALKIVVDCLERCGKYEEACKYQKELMEWNYMMLPDDYLLEAGDLAARLIDLMIKAGKTEEAKVYAESVIPELMKDMKYHMSGIMHIRTVLADL